MIKTSTKSSPVSKLNLYHRHTVKLKCSNTNGMLVGNYFVTITVSVSYKTPRLVSACQK